MIAARRHFSPFVHFYVWSFVALFGLLPAYWVFERAREGYVASSYWVASLIWAVAVCAFFVYARWRCSSAQLSFEDGLRFTAGSMMTGWTMLSFFIVYPALLLAFAGSIAIAIVGDVSRSSAQTPVRWLRFMRIFFRNRMLQ